MLRVILMGNLIISVMGWVLTITTYPIRHLTVHTANPNKKA